ncbi:hypothetical protein [Winogradskyella psychrotolerans]|uniref:hypothetical protein n=1 Tax=Winogradskyella psychrotolerans TaxID=1344585 RepID=UPI001C076F58|nr:hypothetical protein [Winogradskyella psychrotolerans]MBU2930141.1 hypothetical protein [Winogradskyella psychrotolerans]
MKEYITLISIVLLVACKSETKKDTTQTVQVEQKEQVESKQATTENKPVSKGTFLCKINDKDWAYTKASGIVDTHAKTKKRTAIMTFTKKLDKGSESVQLFYDADTYQLEKATAILKTPEKGGGTMSAMYHLLNEGGKRLPDSAISGSIDLSNATSASGTAEVSNMKIRFEEGKLEDQSMAVISFTSLKFSGVGYSDLDKAFGNK